MFLLIRFGELPFWYYLNWSIIFFCYEHRKRKQERWSATSPHLFNSYQWRQLCYIHSISVSISPKHVWVLYISKNNLNNKILLFVSCRYKGSKHCTKISISRLSFFFFKSAMNGSIMVNKKHEIRNLTFLIIYIKLM